LTVIVNWPIMLAMSNEVHDYSDLSVLVTGAGGLTGQGIIRSLRAIESSPRIIATDTSLVAAGFYWADKSFMLPHSSQQDLYLASMAEKSKRNDVKVIFPGSDMEARLLSAKNPDPNIISIAASSEKVWDVTGDKLKLSELCMRLEIPHPITYNLTTDNVEKMIKQYGFPIVIKQRVGSGSRGMTVVRSREDLSDIAFENLRDTFMVQEYLPIEDSEYTVGTYFDIHSEEKNPITIAYRRTLYNGNTSTAITHNPKIFANTIKQLATNLGIVGYANFQFVMKDGEPHLIDLNARFSSSTSMSLSLGYNWVETYLNNLLFNEKPTDFSYDMGIVIVRYFADLILPSEKISKINELLK